MTKLRHRYRVFLSFSHDDRERVDRICRYLQEMNLDVRWSGSLRPGMRFTDQIREGISLAHLFLPVITESAASRPWVHQEIGYALGVNVPVLPLVLGELPGGMADELQAQELRPDLSDLEVQLTAERIEYLTNVQSSSDIAVFEQAAFHEDRTRMVTAAIDRVGRLAGFVRIRQRSPMPIFSFPDKSYHDEIWVRCDGEGPARSPAIRRDLCKERRMLEEHARRVGCDLMIYPGVVFQTRGPKGKLHRLKVFSEFLENMPDDKVRVVIGDPSLHGNLLIMGDWFLAESITSRPGQGYLQTLGTWHAPTVLRRMREFDHEFERELARIDADGRSSRQVAIECIRAEIDRLRFDISS